MPKHHDFVTTHGLLCSNDDVKWSSSACTSACRMYSKGQLAIGFDGGTYGVPQHPVTEYGVRGTQEGFLDSIKYAVGVSAA